MTDLDIQLSGIALVGDPTDPALQLYGEALALDGHGFTTIRSLSQAPPNTHKFVFASHQVFLAELPGIPEISGAIEIVVRRRKLLESKESWNAGIAVLKAALNQLLPQKVELLGLSDDACREIADLLQVHVRLLSLGQEKSDLPTAFVTPETDVIALATETAAPALPISQMNWGRLLYRVRPKLTSGGGTDLADVVECSRRTGKASFTTAQGSQSARRIMFIVSNGVGLGHLTRCMAIARAMQEAHPCEFVFWSYSKAAALAEHQGHAVILRNTAEHLQTSTREWSNWESAELTAYLRRYKPSDIILDGSTIGPAITQALLAPGIGCPNFIWVRRGLWQRDADTSPLDDGHLCDLVIEPGDIAGGESSGPIAAFSPAFTGLGRHVKTAPICATYEAELLSRSQARKALDQSRWGALCLVNLGGDALTSQSFLSSLLIRASYQGNVRFLWARSPFSYPIDTFGEGMTSVPLYPMAKYLKAFDGIISATGYNSFHEVTSLSDAPLLLAPTQHGRLDDQAARANFARRKKIARVFSSNERSAPQKLAEFLGDVTAKAGQREKMVFGNGARETALQILALADRNAGKA